jgi:hypothetical protein
MSLLGGKEFVHEQAKARVCGWGGRGVLVSIRCRPVVVFATLCNVVADVTTFSNTSLWTIIIFHHI